MLDARVFLAAQNAHDVAAVAAARRWAALPLGQRWQDLLGRETMLERMGSIPGRGGLGGSRRISREPPRSRPSPTPVDLHPPLEPSSAPRPIPTGCVFLVTCSARRRWQARLAHRGVVHDHREAGVALARRYGGPALSGFAGRAHRPRARGAVPGMSAPARRSFWAELRQACRVGCRRCPHLLQGASRRAWCRPRGRRQPPGHAAEPEPEGCGARGGFGRRAVATGVVGGAAAERLYWSRSRGPVNRRLGSRSPARQCQAGRSSPAAASRRREQLAGCGAACGAGAGLRLRRACAGAAAWPGAALAARRPSSRRR